MAKMTEYSDEQIRKMFEAGDFSAVVDGNKETRERVIRILAERAKPQDQRVLQLEEENFRLQESVDYYRRGEKLAIKEHAFDELTPIIRDENGDAQQLDLRFVAHLGRWAQEVLEYAEEIEDEVFVLRAKQTEPVVLKSKYDRDIERTRREKSLAEKRYGIERELRNDFYSQHEERFNKRVDDLQKVIDDQEKVIHRLQAQVDVLQVQEPEVQQPEPKSDICMDCLYRVENCKCAEIYEPWTEAELAQQEAAKGVTESAEDVDLDPAAPHGGSDNDTPVVVAQPTEPEETSPDIVETNADLFALNNALASKGLPGHWYKKRGGRYGTILVWDIDGYGRDFGNDPDYHMRRIERGELTLDEYDHKGCIASYPTLQGRNQRLAIEAERDALAKENEQLKQQLAQQETSPEIVSGSAELEQELAETKTLLKIVTEAKDKVIQRNRELEQENTDLKRRIKMLEDLLVHNNIEVPA